MNSMAIQEALGKIPDIAGLNITMEPAISGELAGSDQLVVAYKGDIFRFNIHRRSDLNTTAVAILASRLSLDEKRSNYLLHAPYVNITCGERLRQNGINFIDDAGHVFLKTPGLYLFVVGREAKLARKIMAIPGKSEARSFKMATLKMVYAFLSDPALDSARDKALINRNYRDIGEGTGISLGSVSNAMEDLLAAGYVVEQAASCRLLVNRRKLFERWVQDYGTRLRPKLVELHFRAPSPRWWQNAYPNRWGGVWGGEVAAARMTEFLTPETATIYAEHVPDSFVLENDLRKDPAGNVEILRPFWRLRPFDGEGDCAHPLIVYADLAATDIDRNLQTAQRIYEQHIRQIVESA